MLLCVGAMSWYLSHCVFITHLYVIAAILSHSKELEEVVYLDTHFFNRNLAMEKK